MAVLTRIEWLNCVLHIKLKYLKTSTFKNTYGLKTFRTYQIIEMKPDKKLILQWTKHVN